mgnify:CR=1 FL=1
MKNNAEAMAYFKSMPKKAAIPNPYYIFDTEKGIEYAKTDNIFKVEDNMDTLWVVREYFRRAYEAFGRREEIFKICGKQAYYI